MVVIVLSALEWEGRKEEEKGVYIHRKMATCRKGSLTIRLERFQLYCSASCWTFSAAYWYGPGKSWSRHGT